MLCCLDWHSSIIFCTPYPPPFRTFQLVWAQFLMDRHFSIPIWAPHPRLSLFCCILCCSSTFCKHLFPPITPYRALLYTWLLVSLFIWICHITFQTTILVSSELTSNYTSIRYHKSSHMTLEFNFTDLPGTCCQQIQESSAAPLGNWWFVYSGFCQPW